MIESLKKTYTIPHFLMVVLLALLVSVVLFFPVNKSPTCILIADGGDGLKAYFGTVWQVLYGSGSWFTGMSYPYGDNVMYIDNQPFLSSILSWVRGHLYPLSAKQVVGIMNLLLFQGLVLTHIVVYYLLRKLNLPFWLSFIGAFIIAYHTPQLDRFLGGHFSLGYAFFIPLVWLLTAVAIKGNRGFVFMLLNVLIITIAAFLHMYYLAILVLFVQVYLAVSLASGWPNDKRTWIKYLLFMVMAGLPFILVKLWMNMYDPFTDRIVIPYGIDVYRASWYSMFWPQYMPKPVKAYYQFEGIAYVGWFAIPLLSIVMLRLIGKLRTKFSSSALVHVLGPAMLSNVFWVGIVFALLAKGSIILFMIDLLPDQLEFLRQFRSLGRFAWVFYYSMSVASIYCIYMLYRYLLMKGAKPFGILFLLFALGYSAYETIFYFQPLRNQMDAKAKSCNAHNLLANEGSYSDWITEAGYTVDSFQAIIPLPYYNLGSEKYYITRTGVSRYETFKASLMTGLPISGQYIARTSIGNTLKMVQLLSDDLVKKEIMSDLPDMKKPFLVIYTYEDLNRAEALLLSKCSKIYGNEYIAMYKLYPDALEQAYISAQNEASKINADSIDKACVLTWETFDTETNGHWNAASTDEVFWQQQIADTGVIDLSLWMHVGTKYYDFPLVHVSYKSATDDIQQILGPQSYYNVVGDELRIDTQLPISSSGELTIRITSYGELAELDNLLIYKKACGNVITTGSSGMRYINNFPLQDVTQ